MIEFRSIGKSYRDPGGVTRSALRNISFSLGQGEFAYLTGHSGAGKSTLLRLLTLSEEPTFGELWVDGQTVMAGPGERRQKRYKRVSKRAIQRYRRELGAVFQDHQLLMDRSVYENVVLPLDIMGGLLQIEKARRVKAALDQVGLSGKELKTPMALSGGEQQRVGIARAIAHRPKILLADEPTGNLDPELSIGIMELFQRFSSAGVTVLVATHDFDSIADIAPSARTITLSRGELIGG